MNFFSLMYILQELILNTKLFAGYLVQRILIKNLETKTKGDFGPVIVIMGFSGGGPRQILHEYFTKNNIKSIIADFGAQTDSVENQVVRLGKLLKKHKIKKPILVGFSMGGLVAIRYAQKNGWQSIKKVLTISSPFRGTNLAKLVFWTYASLDLNPESHLLKLINKQKVPKNKVVCIYGIWDQYVNPKSTILKGSVQEKINVYGHDSIVYKLDNIFDKYLLNKL